LGESYNGICILLVIIKIPNYLSPSIPEKMEIWLSQKKKKGMPRSMTQRKERT
jgi:hypothetical protein